MFMIAIAALAAVQGPAPATDKNFEDARQALDANLMDYPSARFRDVRGNAFVICGFVNAKNRLGAYTGWKRFAWLGGVDRPRLISDEQEADDLLLDGFCGEDGMSQKGPDYSDRVTFRR